MPRHRHDEWLKFLRRLDRELESAIQTYIANHNAAPKPFIWTASAKDILAKIARARKVLDAAHGADARK